MIIDLGKWKKADLELLISRSSGIRNLGRRIRIVSEFFIGVPYGALTLNSNVEKKEELVVNLRSVDCFTFLDYVDAIRKSCSLDDFVEKLRYVRYRGGSLQYIKRNHFFSDWPVHRPEDIEDVTRAVGGSKCRESKKLLNVGRGGIPIVKGLQPFWRKISYISSADVVPSVLRRLRTGDYVGIYSNREGLDVSHVGIIIKAKGEVYLRHASSSGSAKKVVDQGLAGYIVSKHGIVVLRPKESEQDPRDPLKGN